MHLAFSAEYLAKKKPRAWHTKECHKTPSGSLSKFKIGASINLGNGRNTVSRVLFEKRELTESWANSVSVCEKLGEFALARAHNRL